MAGEPAPRHRTPRQSDRASAVPFVPVAPGTSCGHGATLCALLTQVDDARTGTAPIPSKPVLVVGAACSGTTWVAGTLSRIADLPYVYEPTIRCSSRTPWSAPRSGLGAYPAIRPTPTHLTTTHACGTSPSVAGTVSFRPDVPVDSGGSVPVAEKLGELDPIPADAESTANAATDDLSRRARAALRLARPSPRGRVPTRRVVSSVDAPLALDWIVQRYVPEVVFVRRHPLDVVASRMRELVNAHGGDVFVDERSIDERVVRWRIPRRPSAGHRSRVLSGSSASRCRRTRRLRTRIVRCSSSTTSVCARTRSSSSAASSRTSSWCGGVARKVWRRRACSTSTTSAGRAGDPSRTPHLPVCRPNRRAWRATCCRSSRSRVHYHDLQSPNAAAGP